MRPPSLRLRLTGAYALFLALTFAAAGAGAWWMLRHSIHETVDNDLQERHARMRELIERLSARRPAEKLAEELAELGALAPAGAYFRLAGPAGRWIYQAPLTAAWPPAPPAGAAAFTRTVGRKPFRVLAAPTAAGPLEIGIPVDEYYEMLDHFSWGAAIASPFLLLLASVGGAWLSGRALRPVDEITAKARAIGARNLAERLPVRGAGDELDRLSETLNAMFARLDAAFQRVTQFTADASHELRTPVAIIRTTAELARSRARDKAEYERALDRILAASERTSRLIEDLLVLARGDAGAASPPPVRVDLAALLRDACAEARVLASAAEVELQPDSFPAAHVSGDPHALRRLLLILLDNAVKFSPPGSQVQVRLSAAGPLEIEVCDHGVGIAAGDLPHIFERFYRAAKDRSRQGGGGAGLGLSIAQAICERHGAVIQAESVPGAGSTFRVRFTGPAARP